MIDSEHEQTQEKVEPRALPAHYLSCVGKANYQVYRSDTKKITTIGSNEFVLTSTAKEKDDDKNHTDDRLQLSRIARQPPSEEETPARNLKARPGSSSIFQGQPLTPPKPNNTEDMVRSPNREHIAS